MRHTGGSRHCCWSLITNLNSARAKHKTQGFLGLLLRLQTAWVRFPTWLLTSACNSSSRKLTPCLAREFPNTCGAHRYTLAQSIYTYEMKLVHLKKNTNLFIRRIHFILGGCVLPHACLLVPVEIRRGVQIPWNWSYRGGWGPPCGWWELNTGALKIKNNKALNSA